MDITNDTDTNTRYTVKNSSGSGMGPHNRSFPFRPEETAAWKELAAGSTVRHNPASKGPWKVYFFVDGHGVTAEASSDNDRVQLVAQADTFRANVRKVARGRVHRTPTAV